MSEELKPCPFCHSTKLIIMNEWPVYRKVSYKRWHVLCGKCWCMTHEYSTKQYAVSRWNTRADKANGGGG